LQFSFHFHVLEQAWSTQSCGVDPTAPDVPYNKCIQYYFVDKTTTTGTPGSSTASGASTTVAPAGSCRTCATCVAVPGNSQAAVDSQCAPCGSGTLQTWWPCIVYGLCQCAADPTFFPTSSTVASSTSTSSTVAPITTRTSASTAASTTASSTTQSISTTVSVSSCTTCATFVAVPGNIQAATDSQCQPCGSKTLQTWWPCNVAGLCQGGVGGCTTTVRPTTAAAPTTKASTVNPCASCATCEAIPNNPAGAIDEHCVPCGSGTLQASWPCNQSNLCRCKV
jgi:hypothetical protein